MGMRRIQHWWFMLPLRLKSIFLRGRVDQELDEEMQFHLDHKIEEGIAAGLSPAEARFRALRAMGGLEQRKEEARDMRRINWLTDFVADVKFALRSLRRTPGLTAFVVITLALGIGMTTAPFSMLDALIFRPYPVPHPGNVVTLVTTTHDEPFDSFAYREYLDVRDRARSYDGVIANSATGTVGFSAELAATPRPKGGQMVSANFFSVLGVQPQLGRGFREDEDRVPGRDAVTVLGPGFWKSEFSSDPSVIGRKIRLNGTEFTVVGVAPDSFPGMQVFSRPDVYVPLAMAPTFSTNPQKNFFEDRDDRELTLRARLKADVTIEQARNELAGLARDFAKAYPEENGDRGATVHTFYEMRTRGDDVNWKFSVIFTLLALAVLLVACTNVAGLLLSRARTRTREIAVRLALGAGRFRLIRLLLTESLILAGVGGLGAIAVGYAGIRFFQNFTIPTELPTVIPFRMDLRVLAMSLALSLLAAILCGLAPALQSSRADLSKGLKAADVDVPGRRRLWGRNALVVAQVATSLMLLTAAFLMTRSFHHSVLKGIGFAKDHLLIARFDPRLVQYDAARTQRFYERLAERVREAPGVAGAALTRNPPLGLGGFDSQAFVPEGFEMPPDRESFTATTDTIDEGYFATLGIPLLHGRAFLPSDTAAAPRVAIVNEQFAQHYWPDLEPPAVVGQRIRLERATGEPVEIVGVARKVRYHDGAEKPTDFLYLPLAQRPQARMVLLIKTPGDPLQWVDSLKSVVRELDPNMPLLETRSYEDLYRYSAVEGPGVAIRLVSAMGGVGLILAIAGLYGLVAYNVSRRTREIGIRMAIGAGPVSVIRLVMGKGLVLVGIGTAIGLALGFGVERLMKSTLFNDGGVDVVAYLVVVPSMVLVTLLAAYLPARRAARIAPTLALRCE